jgi:hypothetical protein
VLVVNSTFSNSVARLGAAIYSRGSTSSAVVVRQSDFISNAAFHRGGSVATIANATLDFSDCLFLNSYSANIGGAASFLEYTRANFRNVSFLGSTAFNYAAALILGDFSNFTGESLEFVYGTVLSSVSRAACMVVNDNATSTISESFMGFNKGGSLLSDGFRAPCVEIAPGKSTLPGFYRTVEFRATRFFLNGDTRLTSDFISTVGSIFVWRDTILTLKNCRFERNVAKLGSGVYALGDGGTKLLRLLVRGTTFANNVATMPLDVDKVSADAGAGIYIYGDSVFLDIDNATFSGNTATDGADIYNGLSVAEGWRVSNSLFLRAGAAKSGNSISLDMNGTPIQALFLNVSWDGTGGFPDGDNLVLYAQGDSESTIVVRNVVVRNGAGITVFATSGVLERPISWLFSNVSLENIDLRGSAISLASLRGNTAILRDCFFRNVNSSESLLRVDGGASVNLSSVVVDRVRAVSFLSVGTSSAAFITDSRFTNSVMVASSFEASKAGATLRIENSYLDQITAVCSVAVCGIQGQSVQVLNLAITNSRCVQSNYAVMGKYPCPVFYLDRFRGASIFTGVAVRNFAAFIFLVRTARNSSTGIEYLSSTNSGGVAQVISQGGSFSLSHVSFRTEKPVSNPLLSVEIGLVSSVQLLFSNITVQDLVLAPDSPGLISLRFEPLDIGYSAAWDGVKFSARGQDVIISNVTSLSPDGGVVLSILGPWSVQLSRFAVSRVSALGAASRGGSILLKQAANLTLTDSFIEESSASAGGFASIEGRSSLSLRNVTVQRCSARGLSRRTIPSSGQTEALFAKNASCSARLSRLTELAASQTLTSRDRFNGTASSGGAVILTGGSTFTAANCTFSQNFAIDRGGFMVSGGSVGQISFAGRVQFIDNTASAGAALFMSSKDTRVLADAEYSGNCARFDSSACTIPDNLYLNDSGEVLQVLSGAALPRALIANVLDAYGNRFQYPSFFSVQLKTEASSQFRLEGTTNTVGLLGIATFPPPIDAYGRPGVYSVLATSDDSFADYPSSKIRANFTIRVLPCPAGRFVDPQRLACLPCPSNTFSSKTESENCTAPPNGFYSLDGTSVVACATTFNQAFCSSSSSQSLLLSVSISSPIGALVIGGVVGYIVWLRRRQNKMVTSAEWRITEKEVQEVRKIGQGSFGEVWLSVFKGSLVVVKKICDNLDQASQEDSAIEEIVARTIAKRPKAPGDSKNVQAQATSDEDDDEAQKILLAEINLHAVSKCAV